MTMVASYFILRETYTLKQIGAAATVLAGVGFALVPTVQDSHADSTDGAGLQVRMHMGEAVAVADSLFAVVSRARYSRRSCTSRLSCQVRCRSS